MKAKLKKMIRAGDARIVEGAGVPRYGVVKKAGGMEHKALREYFDSEPVKPTQEETPDEDVQTFPAPSGDSEETEGPAGGWAEDD